MLQDAARLRPEPRAVMSLAERLIYDFFTSGYNTLVLVGPRRPLLLGASAAAERRAEWSTWPCTPVPGGRTQGAMCRVGRRLLLAGGFQLTSNNIVLSDGCVNVMDLGAFCPFEPFSDLGLDTNTSCTLPAPKAAVDRAGLCMIPFTGPAGTTVLPAALPWCSLVCRCWPTEALDPHWRRLTHVGCGWSTPTRYALAAELAHCRSGVN
jgi:hypothetical protein